ncbi:MAG: 4-hydroxy-tetrahydrodipicolinate reductase [Leptospiraceae bacterium]|nr:4-hydroxy-tetrahydrodipicolinate reductase [Leptospiraceae bacterium]MCP5497842.1 4-hydroxy-tetrahydrodipicolinate reductase [Leptospiraceae bacterium]
MDSNNISVSVLGVSGRMGKAIIQSIASYPNCILASGVEKKDSVYVGMDSGLNAGIRQTNIPITDNLEEAVKSADVVIDFSSHQNTHSTLETVTKYKKPLVMGVTGLGEKEKSAIQSASKSIPIVFSPNMSVGVNLLFKLVELAASVLGGKFDIEVLDIHHRHKRDSPSGTSHKLKEVLLKTLNRTENNVIYGREGLHDERESKEIAIHSMRAGEVVGEHTVMFFSPEERVEIKHSAIDRKTFAVGSLRAAEFVVNKSYGLYDMFDVLGL